MCLYCVICGTLIRRTSFPPDVPPDKELEWIQQLRVVQRHEQSGAASISGIGYINSHDAVLAPLDAENSYEDIRVPLQEFAPRPDHPPWNYFLHEECWKILLLKVPEGLTDIAKFADLLANWLYCSNWDDFRHFRPGYDFGGAFQFQKPYRYPPCIIAKRGYPHFLAKPFRPEGLAQLLLLSDARIPRRARANTVSRQNEDVFSRLPIEVLYVILAMMPTADIRNLLAGSKFVASICHPTDLPQPFWRSRFSPDSEMGILLPTEAGRHADWRTAYFAAKDLLSRADTSPSLKNRLRIWRIVTLNEPLFTHHMSNVPLSGTASPEYHGRRPQELNGLACQHPGRLVAAEVSSDTHGYMEQGCRKIFDRAVVLPLDKCTVSRLWASTIEFNSQSFISGIVFDILDVSSNCTTSYCLGYISSKRELVAEISSPTRLTGFNLATRINGIVGIRAILKDSSRTFNSGWVGSKGRGESQGAFGSLLLYGEQYPSHLVAQFDAFKMLAIGVLNPESNGERHLELQPLWTRSWPRQEQSILSTMAVPRPPAFSPILNIDFGGRRGKRLPHLTRITGHLLERSAPLVGLAFHFDNNTYIFFGRQGQMEIPHFIDGPAGERIVKVGCELSPRCGIVCLRFHTNHGRELCIAPTNVSLPPRPFGEIVEDGPQPYSTSYREEQLTVDTLHAAEGQQITGFISLLRPTNYTFQTFALQCDGPEPSPARTPPRDSTPSPCLSLTEFALSARLDLITARSNRCMVYTSASLHGIKRISFSRGGVNRPRLPGELSGLFIEYYGSQKPSILGQFISEAHSMILQPGERIKGVTFYMTRAKITPNPGMYHLGRVLQMTIFTSAQTESYPESVSLAPHGNDALRFHETRLETISHLFWAFNNAWDFPRVKYSPKLPGKRVTCWCPIDCFASRPWTAPQKALWKNTDENDTIASIAGFYGYEYFSILKGLRFIYRSRSSIDIGNVSGSQTDTAVRFDPDDAIQTIELFRDRKGLLALNFHTTNKVTGDTQIRALIDTPPTEIERHPMGGRVHRSVIDLQGGVFREETLETQSPQEEEQTLPNGEAVGLWGAEIPTYGLHIGVLFLQDEAV